jgi:hypothetical protein
MGTIYRVHERNPRLQYYNNNLDYYTLNTPLKCNVNAMTLYLKSSQYTHTIKIKLMHLKTNKKCRRSLQILNADEEDLLHKRVLPSWIVLEQIPESSQKVHQPFKCKPCFGEITNDENNDVSSQAE